ncbi:hypothetical protein EDD21DRAFT_344000 [Dissophora ornata]|nr:hypothetical protein EDD21DRAFT_344000 [Dissophora ornata]
MAYNQGYGGYQQQQQQQQAPYGQQQAPYGQQQAPADASLRQWFDAVDADRSGQLSTEELQRALINGTLTHPFNYETVRLMMNMFDTGKLKHELWRGGKINFAEFSGLWKYIEEWRTCFRAFDQDQSGSIDFNELRTAMRSFRYNLSDDFLKLLIKKYDKNGRGDVSFDNFVQIAVTVKSLTDAFMRIDREGKGYATIGYEQVMFLIAFSMRRMMALVFFFFLISSFELTDVFSFDHS